MDSLLTELDKAIDYEKEYVLRKQIYLDKLKDQFYTPSSLQNEQYLICYTLAKEYESLMCNLAIFSAEKSLQKATDTRNTAWIYDSKIQLARSQAKARLFF